jgi:hypothetical protein
MVIDLFPSDSKLDYRPIENLNLLTDRMFLVILEIS